MTNLDPIEDALRRAAPDEPAAMPPLAIDEVATTPVGDATVGRRVSDPGAPRRAGGWPFALVGAVVMAVVVWQLAGTAGPAPSPSSTPAPEPSTAQGPSAAPDGLATFHESGISFEYPATWQLHMSGQMSMMGSTIAIVGTVDLSACGGLIVDPNCAYSSRLAPGDILVDIGTGASPVGSLKEPPGGFVNFVDGMPAVLSTLGPIPQTGQDESRTWQIGMPGVIDNWYVVTGSFRGPGLDVLRDQLDALVRSIRFDHPAPSLPTDAAAIDALVAKAVDALDRDGRVSYHSTYYACFPRHVGSSAPALIEDGPGGPLVGPIRVTCTVSMKAEAVGLFAMTLAASWEAGPGYAAGTYREVVQVTGDGELGSMQSFNDSFFPATAPEVTPGPAKTPVALATGSLVKILNPGVTFYEMPDSAGNALSDLPGGERVWIVDGPKRAGDMDWYLVQWQPTPIYGGIPGWMTATVHGHPTVESAKPRCPAAGVDVAGLVGLIPAERVACFGSRPITIGPVILGARKDTTAEVGGAPDWLASTSSVSMYGTSGPDGVDLPLLVRGDPTTAANLPLSTWLEVTGHFDDPAAAGCQRSWIGDLGSTPIAETAAEQVLSCREQFVITAIQVVASP